MTNSSLDGRVALVTGAASGMGAAIAAAYCREGARVVFADRDEESAAQAASTAPDRAQAEFVDVSDEASVKALFDRLASQDLMPDILVNAAGILGGDTLKTATRASMDQVFSINVYGSVFTMKYAAPEMIRKRRGKIINFSSVAIHQPSQAISYAASKHAVVGITQTAAFSLAEHGIQVNAIAPGQVNTAMWQSIVGHQRQALERQGGDPGSFEASIVAAIPLGRIAEPEEICGLALFLASPASDYMTGQTLGINGGNSMG